MSLLLPRDVIFQLALADTIGPVTIGRIRQFCTRMGITLQELTEYRAHDLVQHKFCSPALAERIVRGFSSEAQLHATQTGDRCIQEKISWCTILDAEYPPLLLQLEAPPPLLFWQGSLVTAQERTIAFVGSRDATAYGQRCIDLLVPSLCEQRVHVISGGARGIDSMAHRAVLAHGGRTTAVLGSGLLKPYPAEHKKLFADIVSAGGCVLSSFSIDAPAAAGNFPARNRIIAGLSERCIVVQAARESGALITARWALDLGRDIGAVPGPIDDPRAAGCNQLIAQGAQLITGPEDLGLPAINSRAINSHQKPVPEKVIECPVFDHLAQIQHPVTVDYLVAQLALPYEDIIHRLCALQERDVARQDWAGLWSRS